MKALIATSKAFPGETFLAGFSRGELLAEEFSELAYRVSSNDPPLQIGFDFAGAEATTGSFVKGSLLAAFELAQTWAIDGEREIFPYAVNACRDVIEEIDEIFGRRSLSFPIASHTKPESFKALVVGNLDPAIAKALASLNQLTSASAGELAAAFPGEKVNITAWNNRLVELWKRRLAVRSRQGKFWIYKTIFGEISYGRTI